MNCIAPQVKSLGIILQQKIVDAIARSMAVSLCDKLIEHGTPWWMTTVIHKHTWCIY